ncbi:TPA: hypothetical protein PQW26_002324 [Staphylococcus aureus]|nr:hypothetical protein [Staphylococcus aureus]HDJ5653217.1 hypothetical protein [Staphylococcus aureus]HDJ6334036.1 hypothetical protein [Staphylococcus aureus]
MMNQNEQGKIYQTYLLKEFFSDKPLFNVEALTEREKNDLQHLKENLNPNIKAVIEESVANVISPFYELDKATKGLREVENQMKNVENIEIKDYAFSKYEDIIYQKSNQNKENFNYINQRFQIAKIEHTEPMETQLNKCEIASFEDGQIELEVANQLYQVTIPHESYLKVKEAPNRYDFMLDKSTGNIIYKEKTETIEMSNDGLEKTPRHLKKQVVDEQDNELER